MCDDDKVSKDKDLPKEIWKFIADKKFFGMIIPKKYGGLGFSGYAHSAVIQKLPLDQFLYLLRSWFLIL